MAGSSPERSARPSRVAPARTDADSLPPADHTFENAFRHAAVGKAFVGLDGRWTKVNDALCRMLGYSREELLAIDFQTLTHPADLDADLALVDRLVRGDIESYELEKRYLRKDDSLAWGLLSVSLVRTAQGTPDFFVAEVQDVTRRKHAESQIEAFFQASPDMLAIAHAGGWFVAINDAWERALGWTKQELTCRPFLDVVHPEDRSRTALEAEAAHAGGPARVFRSRFRTKHGPYRWLEWNCHAADVGLLYCVVRDVTEGIAEADAQARAKSLLEASIAHVRDGVALLDARGRIVFANAAYAEFLGLPPEAIVGLTRESFFRHLLTIVDDPAAFLRGFSAPLAMLVESCEEVVLRRPWRRVVRRTLRAIQGAGLDAAYVAVWQDVTTEVDLVERREREVLTDELTGIPNRRAAEVALVRRVTAASQRVDARVSLVIFDVDHFKQVNDVHGHDAGDRVLRRVAATLAQEARGGDVVARWGGEEFIAVLPVGVEGARAFCERAREAVESLAVAGVGRVTVSAGIAAIDEAGLEPALRRADARLYEAKRAGRNRVVG